MTAETKVNASEILNPQSAHESRVGVTIRSSQVSQNTNDPFDPKSPLLDQKPTKPEVVKKPSAFSLDKFKSKHAAAAAGVDTLQAGLPHNKLAQAKDFVRLHPDEDTYWSPELCFVNVPIKGQKRDTLHLIDEELALDFLPSGKIMRFRLVLGTKPHDVFFLCEVPTRNEDNSWNASNLLACERAKTTWVQATSRREEGVDGYKVDAARDPNAFPEPKWPTQSLADLIDKAFAGRMVDQVDHPALLRLIGAKQSVS